MPFAKLKIFTGTSLFLLLAGAVAPSGMAQTSQMNQANCPEAYRGEVIDIDNEWVTLERPNGDKELLDLSHTEKSLLGVGIGSELVVCEDGKVTNAIQEIEFISDETGLRDRIAETFRRLEEEQAARRRAAAREREEVRVERTRTQPVRVAPAATPRPIPQPVRVEEARPVRALW